MKEMGKFFLIGYDFFMSPLESGKLKEIRKELIRNVYGSVLEIGSGTGINFPYYQAGTHVVAIEPSQVMIERSQSRMKNAEVPIEIIKEGAEKLPFIDNSFDTIVATLVFCTISDSEAALKEIIRVCKPGGQIFLVEHVKMDNPFLAKMQDLLTPFWRKICDGCCLNRNTVQTIESIGLVITRKRTFYKGLFVQLDITNVK
jgi:ubiquinone/menaquinone biosynthesis C-methylase UbiE